MEAYGGLMDSNSTMSGSILKTNLVEEGYTLKSVLVSKTALQSSNIESRERFRNKQTEFWKTVNPDSIQTQRDSPSQHKGNEAKYRSQAFGWDYADRSFPTNFPFTPPTQTVRQTLNVLNSRRHQSSGQGGGGGTFAGRNRSRGRYSRHAEGNSIIFTVLRKFYANQVRSCRTACSMYYWEKMCSKHK